MSAASLLNWIAMLAFTDNRKPDFLDKQMENGHAYAGWRLERVARGER